MNRQIPFAAIVLLASASAALAQNNAATQPLPGLDNFSLPSSRPTPRRVPDPEPTVRAAASAPPRAVVPPVAVPTVRAARAARAAAIPVARATPAPARTAAPRSTSPAPPTPVATATPSPAVPIAIPAPPVATEAPAPVATAQPAALPYPSASEPDRAPAMPIWIWSMAGCVLLAILVGSSGWWWPRLKPRRADVRGQVENREILVPVADDAPPPPAAVPPPSPAPLVVPPAPWLTGDRATLDLELIPNRAGTDAAGLVVDYLIVVRNGGKAAASGVRLDVRLLGAGAGQDQVIGALFAAPIDAPIAQPFDLPAGASAEFEGNAAHPLDTLQVMTIGGQRSVVPVLAVNVRYEWHGGGYGQTAHSYVIGIARGAEAKLRPFRLDGPARMHASVSALDYPVRAVT